MRVKNHSINMIYSYIIFSLIGTLYPVNAQVGGFVMMAGFALTSYQTMDGIHDTILKFETASTDDIMASVADLSTSVDKWGNRIQNQLQEMNTFLRRLPLLGEIAADVRVILEYFTRIDNLYKEFQEFVADPASFNEETVKNLLEVFTSRKGDDVVSIIGKLHNLVVSKELGEYKKSMLLLLAQETQEYALEVCDVGVPQYRLLDFYSIIATEEMRALTMTGTGYLIKALQKNTSYTGELKRVNKSFLARVKSYLILLRQAMAMASRQFRRCDPPEGYERDESFFEFERFLQSIVANEITLISSNDCWKTCETIPRTTKVYPCEDIGNGCDFYTRPTCNGWLRDCRSLQGDTLTCEIPGNGARRYQWVRDGAGQYHPGDTSSCHHDNHFHRFQSLVGVAQSCDMCRCHCAEDNFDATSTRFVNLREQLSDVANNKVIIGLQFVIVDKIAHVEVLQGSLQPNGTIDVHAVEWMPLEKIKYAKRESIQAQSFKFYKQNTDGSQEEMMQEKDVAVLNYDSRRINLDRLSAPKNHLVTGIKFVRDEDGSGKPLHLEIQATPFDYQSGELDTGKSVWIGPEDTFYAKNAEIRTEYVGEGNRNPEPSKITMIDTKPNSYIDLQSSDWDTDASQTVIPLLDAVPVYAEPLIPLTGVGLYHKKQKGYGGFLTFVLEGLDKSLYIMDKIPGEKEEQEEGEGGEEKEETEEKEEKVVKPRRRGRNRS